MTTLALQSRCDRDDRHWSFRRLVLDLINGFREAQAISYRYAQLSHLSDAELTKLGMRREDLPRIALNGRA